MNAAKLEEKRIEELKAEVGRLLVMQGAIPILHAWQYGSMDGTFVTKFLLTEHKTPVLLTFWNSASFDVRSIFATVICNHRRFY